MRIEKADVCTRELRREILQLERRQGIASLGKPGDGNAPRGAVASIGPVPVIVRVARIHRYELKRDDLR